MRISDWSSDVCSSDRRTMAKDHGSQIKDDETYEALRDDGASKEKAARIANARAGGSLDHRGTDLEDRTKEELYDEAKGLGIECRSDMSKDRKNGVSGKSVSVRVDLGGRRINKKKKTA